MCRYRYYYFGACRHQQTVLFDFCERAQVLQRPQDISDEASLGFNNGKNDLDRSNERTGGGHESDCIDNGNGNKVEEVASTDETTNPDALHSTSWTQSSTSIQSSFDAGSTLLTAEPNIECASLSAANISHPSTSTSSSHDMATSLLGDAFSRWMGGAGSAMPKQDQGLESTKPMSTTEMLHKQRLQADVPKPRKRPPGIRERTDESCDLPQINEIMQHLAESCRGQNALLGQRSTSYRSVATDSGYQEPAEAPHETYDTLEAEIDQLKEDITRLKEEADRGRMTPKTEQELANDRFLATRSLRGRPSPVSAPSESAAARLQRQHEADTADKSTGLDSHHGAHQPLSPLDFPTLGPSVSGSQAPSNSQSRKLSYADAITNGIVDANDHAYSAAMAKRAESKASESGSDEPMSASSATSRTKTGSTTATHDSDGTKEDEESSTIVSPRSTETDSITSDPILVADCQPSAKNGKPARATPHFARPTQSYSRRTGDSARGELSPSSPRDSPGSPTKSMKAREPCLATEKRATQRQHQRKSLPGDWIGTDGKQPICDERENPVKTAKAVASTKRSPPVYGAQISQNSPEAFQKVARRNVKQQVNSKQAKTKQIPPQSPLRTKATVQLASNNIAKTCPPVIPCQIPGWPGSPLSTPRSNQAKPHETHQSPVIVQRSNTMSSDASSVQFILDGQDPTYNVVLDQAGNIDRSPPAKLADTRAQIISPALRSAPVIASSDHSNQVTGSNLTQSKSHQESGNLQQAPQSDLSAMKDIAEFTHFAAVSNTTAKRRSSHGHLLTPIMACLDAKGLLNKTAATSNNMVVESYLKSASAKAFSNALNEARKSAPDSPKRVLQRQTNASDQTDGSVPSRKVLPPHLRNSRKVGSNRNSEDSNGQGERSLMEEGPIQVSVGSNLKSSPEGFTTASEPAQQARKTSLVSSLRATANEFKPTEPTPPSQTGIDVERALGYWPEEQWLSLNEAQKHAIVNLRHQFPPQASLIAKTMQPQPSFHPQQQYAGNMPWIADAGLLNPSVSAASVNDNPHNVQTGQILKPCISPGKKTVQWMLQDLDGKETPIKFGRAPPPALSPSFGTATPSSSSVGIFSPYKTPHTSNAKQPSPWQIRSTRSPARYGWTGGDGKEIKFTGYGPHAERDPNSVVDFDFQGRKSSHHASVPNGFDEDKENYLAEARAAPRSQRQWAESMNYHKVPCGDVEITDAVEHCIPFGSQLAGYCHDCMADS